MQHVVIALKSFQLHPFVDHFTVALLIVAVIADLFGSLFAARPWIRYMALCLLIVGTGAAWASNVTGGWEADRIWNQVTGPAKQVLERHAKIGDILPWVFVALAIWRIGTEFLAFLRPSRFIYLIIAVLAALAIVYQGRIGGEMVYRYGVGTKVMPVAEIGQPQALPTPSANLTPPISSSPIPTVSVPTPTPLPSNSTKPTPLPTASASVSETPLAAAPIIVPKPALSPEPSATPGTTTPVRPPPA